MISSCVNFVGVDLNTASVPLLRHVSGLNQLTARRIVDRRQEKGPFTDRERADRDRGGRPGHVHPGGRLPQDPRRAPTRSTRRGSTPRATRSPTRLLEKFGFTPEILNDQDRLPELHAKLNEADLPALARELEVGEPTLHDIFEALARPDRDPRDDLPKPIFKKGVLKLEDLTAGMELKGTVLNVVDFGAFIDIGLKDSGLVHISQLANRYIKSPHDVVSVGDVVTAWVMGVDNERKRVSLTMVKPGTERPEARARGRRRPRPRRGPAAAASSDEGPAAPRRRPSRLGQGVAPRRPSSRPRPPARPAAVGPGSRAGPRDRRVGSAAPPIASRRVARPAAGRPGRGRAVSRRPRRRSAGWRRRRPGPIRPLPDAPGARPARRGRRSPPRRRRRSRRTPSPGASRCGASASSSSSGRPATSPARAEPGEGQPPAESQAPPQVEPTNESHPTHDDSPE